MLIIDKDSYKLKVSVKKIITGENQVILSRWNPETNWINTELYLSNEELDKLKQSLC